MSRRERSRSPAGASEWISRQIVQFGRYPDKRPSGLRVEKDGTMTVESLMSSWGKGQGYTQDTILQAVQKHMFNSQNGADGSPTLRFTLSPTADGRDFTIKVHQSRAAGSAGVATPARSWAGGSEPRDDADAGDDRWKNKDVDWWKSESSWKEDDKWQKKDEGDSWWEKEKDEGKDAWKGGGDRKGYGRQQGEKVQRWLAYVLKKGYHDMRISLDDDGSASMSDIVWAIGSSRQNFDINSEDELKALIEETDQEGRFQIDDGRIRKLPRGQRSQRQTPASGAAAAAAPAAAAGNSWQQQRRTHRKVTTPPRDAHPRDAHPAGIPGAPQLPPGPGWTRYQDDGVLWWYYEGSHGKWWCQEGFNKEPDAASLAPFDD